MLSVLYPPHSCHHCCHPVARVSLSIYLLMPLTLLSKHHCVLHRPYVRPLIFNTHCHHIYIIPVSLPTLPTPEEQNMCDHIRYNWMMGMVGGRDAGIIDVVSLDGYPEEMHDNEGWKGEVEILV